MRVLIVEDAEPLRRLIARIMSIHGVDVRQAADGREALESLTDFEPDVVLTDLRMPVIDGFELINRLRDMSRYDAVRIIAMTAAMSEESEGMALWAGAEDVIAKPLDRDTLLGRICGLGT